LHRARGLAAARRQLQLWRCAASRLCCVILASVVGYFPAALRSLSAHAALFLAWRERDSRLSSAVHILWSRCGALFSGIHSAAPGLRRSARILRLHRHAISGRTQPDPGRDYPVPSLQQPQIKIIRCTGMPARTALLHRAAKTWTGEKAMRADRWSLFVTLASLLSAPCPPFLRLLKREAKVCPTATGRPLGVHRAAVVAPVIGRPLGVHRAAVVAPVIGRLPWRRPAGGRRHGRPRWGAVGPPTAAPPLASPPPPVGVAPGRGWGSADPAPRCRWSSPPPAGAPRRRWACARVGAACGARPDGHRRRSVGIPPPHLAAATGTQRPPRRPMGRGPPVGRTPSRLPHRGVARVRAGVAEAARRRRRDADGSSTGSYVDVGLCRVGGRRRLGIHGTGAGGGLRRLDNDTLLEVVKN